MVHVTGRVIQGGEEQKYSAVYFFLDLRQSSATPELPSYNHNHYGNSLQDSLQEEGSATC
jgi:hypothetical protein